MDYKLIYKISKIYNIIEKDKTSNMLSHAYLISYKDAYLLEKISKYICLHVLDSLNNTSLEQKILNNNHSDIKYYPNKDKTIKVKDIDEICEDSFIMPFESDKKIFVLKDFDKTNIIAQNKLLKTLEEPSKSVSFMILTTNQYNILPTIKSRCKIIKLPEFDEDALANNITNEYKLDEKTAKSVIKRSFGSFLDLERLLKKDTNIIHEACLNTLKNLQNSSQVLEYSVKLMDLKSPEEILDEFLYLFRDLGVVKTNSEIFFTEDKDIIRSISNNYTSLAIDKLAKCVVLSKQKIKSNCSVNNAIEDVLMKILEVKNR